MDLKDADFIWALEQVGGAEADTPDPSEVNRWLFFQYGYRMVDTDIIGKRQIVDALTATGPTSIYPHPDSHINIAARELIINGSAVEHDGSFWRTPLTVYTSESMGTGAVDTARNELPKKSLRMDSLGVNDKSASPRDSEGVGVVGGLSMHPVSFGVGIKSPPAPKEALKRAAITGGDDLEEDEKVRCNVHMTRHVMASFFCCVIS